MLLKIFLFYLELYVSYMYEWQATPTKWSPNKQHILLLILSWLLSTCSGHGTNSQATCGVMSRHALQAVKGLLETVCA